MSELKGILTLITTGIFAYLGMDQVAFYALCWLLVIDTVFGYINAGINKDFNSTTAVMGFFKKLAILAIPITIVIYGKIIGQDVSKVTAGIFALVGIAQVYSIVGHIYYLHTGEKVSEYDAMTIVIKHISDKIHKFLEKILENNKK